MFQAKLRGWRRLAAGLVLVPGLTGLGADALGFLGRAAAQDRPASGARADEARDLMRRAREAYDEQNYGKARELAEKARAIKAPAAFYDDAPDDLLADLSTKAGGKATRSSEPTTSDPRALVEMAKQAQAKGDFDRAQDLATQAQAHSKTVRWGLFDDTPETVLKDLQKSKGRRDKDTSDRLLTEARALYAKPAPTRAERAANLIAAEEKAKQAEKLHGEYSMWDFGDRPADIIGDCRKARDKERLTSVKPAGASRGMDTERPTPTRTATRPAPKTEIRDERPSPYGESPKPAGGDALVRKKTAVALMQEGMALKVGGNYIEARKKFTDAVKLNAWFGKDEDTPETQLAHLNVAAQKKINAMTGQAKSCLARNDETAARVMLDEAGSLAAGMGLDGSDVAELKLALKPVKETAPVVRNGKTDDLPAPIIRTGGRNETSELPPAVKPPMSDDPPYSPVAPVIKNGKPDEKSPAVKIPPAAPEKAPVLPGLPGELTDLAPPPSVKKPAPEVKLPADPTLEQKVADVLKPPMLPIPEIVKPPMPEKVPVVVKPPMPDRGQEMLKQARIEFKNKDLEASRKLVTEILAGPYSCKDEAAALLTSIDTMDNERKISTAKKAFENGMELFHAHNYAQALAVFNQIDGTLLAAADRKRLAEMVMTASAKQKATRDATAGTKPMVVEELPGSPVPTPRVGADNVVKQKEALSQVEFQKLRSKGLKIESEATARFGKGETDAALQDLQNFVAEVKGTSLDTSKQNLLCRPIEARMDRIRVLKHQTDFLTKESRDRRNFKTEMAQDVLEKQKKHEEVAALMKQATKLMDEAKYKEAYAKLQMAQSLEPDDASVNAATKMASVNLRRAEVKSADQSQEQFNYERMNEWHQYPHVNDKDPLRWAEDEETRKRLMSRKPASSNIMRSRSEAEKVIERKMSTPLSVNFKGMPLEDVVDQLRTMTNMNFMLDTRAMKEDSLDPKQPISATLNNVSLKSALNIICQQAKLKHVIQDESIQITTAKHARGKQTMRTLSVGDLVVPAPNYGQQPGLSFNDMMRSAWESGMGPNRMAGPAGTPRMNSSMGSGTGVGTSNGDANGASGRIKNLPSDGGIQTNGSGSNQTLEKELIRLITTTIKPDSWRELGGEGSIEYFPLGLAMVINQSPEVIEEVERLLESLRKVQDLEVSIEVKVVSLGETFFERIGVDFSMGIRTNAQPSGGIPGGLTTQPGLNGGINGRNFSGNVIGLAAPRVPTPDLDIPIRATSFGRAVPPFGGFSNSFADGGISLGLAFLSDIQVQMFLDAAQGDTRTNVMQAPKVTALNGTSATINVGDYQFFLTGITVVNVAGELVFVPQNVPYLVGQAAPLPQNASIQNGLLNFTPTAPQVPGLYLAVQPVVSADRRFVRLNIQQSFTNLISGTQQIPVTTIVQAQFANGGLGQPVPYTQFLQQPRFSNLEAQTVVVVPDGGTVVMGGLKYMTEGRNEFGPPVLSKIPYLNRLFKNVAYGREGRSILIMVTPRVIINREEQERQTGVAEDEAIGLLGIGGK